MRPITQQQQRVLDFIREHVAEQGWPPTQAEIARGLGFRSANAAVDHVRALKKKGYIDIAPGVARGIRLVTPHSADVLPLIGSVAAGQPILAVENIEEQVDLAPTAFTPRADFLLRVRGESMIDAGIRPNDLLAIHSTHEVNNGQIAVVRIDNEVTVKHYFRSRDKITLKPANMDPCFAAQSYDLHRDTIVLEGLVVGLLRLGHPKGFL